MSFSSRTTTHKIEPARGEPMVWFSGMWLGIGLLMIVTLLGVIVKNGFSIFWPSRVMEIELVEGSPAATLSASQPVPAKWGRRGPLGRPPSRARGVLGSEARESSE
jgi:ABC-type phosphate transport system auxiliary subunit